MLLVVGLGGEGGGGGGSGPQESDGLGEDADGEEHESEGKGDEAVEKCESSLGEPGRWFGLAGAVGLAEGPRSAAEKCDASLGNRGNRRRRAKQASENRSRSRMWWCVLQQGVVTASLSLPWLVARFATICSSPPS